jgi:hypothetical protein
VELILTSRASDHRGSSTSTLLAGLATIGFLLLAFLSLAGTARAATSSSYASVVEADSPSGYWRLDESSGSCSPASAAGAAGSLTATASCVSTAGALSDDADASDGAQALSGGYFTAPSSSADAFTGAFTLEAWVNTSDIAQQGIIEKYDDPSGSNGYGLRLNSSGHLVGLVCNASAAGNCSTVTTPTTLSTNTWYLVDFVANGSTGTIYVNGLPAASATQTQQPTAGSATLKIGAKGDADTDHADPIASFHGSLDEVAIYPTALTATRIAAHYQAGN